jgi:predicted dehydrogenase
MFKKIKFLYKKLFWRLKIKFFKIIKYINVFKKNKNTVSWGIIGTGYMANYLTSILKCDYNSNVISVASRNINKARKFAKKHKIKNYYGSHIEMLQDINLDLDIVYIATPVESHYEYIKTCLKNNKNVLCEKPLVMSVSQFDEVSKLAKDNGCFLMEAMWTNCLPTIKAAKSWIDEGEIGEINLIRADIHKVNNKKTGVLYDFGIYNFAFISNFDKDDTEIISSYKREINSRKDTDWFLHLKSVNNVDSLISLSSNFSASSNAAVIGTKGTIVFNSPFNRTNIVELYNSDGVLLSKRKFNYRFDGFEYQIKEVVQSINNSFLESKKAPLSMTKFCVDLLEKTFRD